MNDPMQLDAHLEIRRRKVEEQSHAYTYLDALTRDKNIAAITALREHLARPAKLFQLDEDGTLEVRSLHSDTLPSPLAFWQESSLFVLLWQQSLLLRLHRQTDLMSASEVAGRVLSSSENTASQQPFLLYVVLAYLAIVHDVPTPAQLQLMRAVAESAEGKMPLDGNIIPTRLIKEVVIAGFKNMEETIPLPIGLWNTARGLVLSGLQAWGLRREQAHHWGTFPTRSRPHEDSSWNQRLQFSALAGMVYSSHQAARLPLPPAPLYMPEELWLDTIALSAGTGTPDKHLRPAGLGDFGPSLLENNEDPRYLALSVEHGQALCAIAAVVLADVSTRPPRYLGHVLDLDIPLHLIPQLQPWGVASLLVQVEPDGMYISVCDKDTRSFAAAWWKADAHSSERTPVTFTPAFWVLLHPVLASVWHDLKADGIVLEKPDLLTTSQQHEAVGSRRKQRQSASKKRQKIYLPPVRTVTKAQWASQTERQTIERAVAAGHNYRRLPNGWYEREQEALQASQQNGNKGSKPAILRRREEATRRAVENQYPPPPPGFTYVSPFMRAGRLAEDSTRTIPSVRARGLFSLRLGLSAHAIEPIQDSDMDERI